MNFSDEPQRNIKLWKPDPISFISLDGLEFACRPMWPTFLGGFKSMKPILAAVLLTAYLLSGCMTVGYHYAKDPNMAKKWDVTVVSVEPQSIYNSAGVFWVGPFASVEAKGWKVTFLDETGQKITIVQPSSNRYQLKPGQKAVYIAFRGQVWVQPTDFPLPADFAEAAKVAQPDNSKQPTVDKPATVKTNAPAPPATNGASRDDAARLEKLKSLKDRGIITQEEYNKKKQEILDAM